MTEKEWVKSAAAKDMYMIILTAAHFLKLCSGVLVKHLTSYRTRQTPHVYSEKDNRSIIETKQIQRTNWTSQISSTGSKDQLRKYTEG